VSFVKIRQGKNWTFMVAILIIFTVFFVQTKDILRVKNTLTKSVYHVQNTPFSVQFYHALAAQTSSMLNSTQMELEQKALKIHDETSTIHQYSV